MTTTTKKPIHTSNLLDRINWILEDRGMTHEQLSARAGFTSRSQVSSILARLRKDPAFASRMEMVQYEKIARGGHVSIHWLWFGTGSPDDSASVVPMTPVGKYPKLEIAIEFHADRWANSTIAAARSLDLPKDLSPQQWTDTLDHINDFVSKQTAKLKSGG